PALALTASAVASPSDRFARAMVAFWRCAAARSLPPVIVSPLATSPVLKLTMTSVKELPIEVLTTLRKRGLQTPVLILTARHTVHDRVRGLDSGADDYLVKPFALPELLARIRALLRRGRTDQI